MSDEKVHVFTVGFPGEYVFYIAATERLGVVDSFKVASPKAALSMVKESMRDKDGVKVGRKVTELTPSEFIKRLEAKKVRGIE